MYKPGDWYCPNEECKLLNFRRRVTCKKCGTCKDISHVPFKEKGTICGNCYRNLVVGHCNICGRGHPERDTFYESQKQKQ